MSEQQQSYEHVNHPQHYGGVENTYEVIKVIEALEMDFHLGNTFKYIARAGKKGSDKDLSCDLCKRNFPEGYINKMPSVVYQGTNPYTMSAEEIKKYEALGNWCIKNCVGYKAAF